MPSQQRVQVVIQAVDQTQSALRNLQQSLRDLSNEAQNSNQQVTNIGIGLGSTEASLKNIIGSMKSLQAAAMGVAAVFAGGMMFKQAFAAIDEYKSNVIGVAAQLTSMKAPKPDEAAKVYAEMKRYAEDINTELIRMDPNVAANIMQLRAMNTVMVGQGVVLDVNNKKQKEGFEALANSLAVIQAQSGQGANGIGQFQTELKALLTGTDHVGSELIKTLKGMDPQLVEHLRQWKAQGTVLEHIGDLLVGYKAATGDIQSLWSTITSTITTLWNGVLREGFAKPFEEAVKYMKELTDNATSQKSIVIDGLMKAWVAMKGVIESLVTIYNELKLAFSTLGDATAMILKGWSWLLSAVLPELVKAFFSVWKMLVDILFVGGSLGSAMLSGLGAVAQAISQIGVAVWKAVTGDFEGAKKALGDMTKTASMEAFKTSTSFLSGSLEDLNKNAKNFMGTMDRIGSRTIDFEQTKFQKQDKGNGTVPSIKPPVDPKAAHEANLAAIAAADAKYKEQVDSISLNLNRETETVKDWLRGRKALFEKGEIDMTQWITDQDTAAKKEIALERTATQDKIKVLDDSWIAKRNHYEKAKGLDHAYASYTHSWDVLILEQQKNSNKLAKTEDDTELKRIADNHKQRKLLFDDLNKIIAQNYKARQLATQTELARGDISESGAKMSDLSDQRAMLQAKRLAASLHLIGAPPAEREQLKKDIKGIDAELENLDATTEKLTADRDWFSGMKRGLQSYFDEATNLGQQMQGAFSNVFKGMEDALVKFVMTGKLSFKDLANSIISDLIRIAVRSSITGPLAGALQSGLSGLFSSPATPVAQEFGGIWSGGLQKFATGGIVASPTLFKMATGMGLMAEAGPEAIMPLTRSASGHLGVRAMGGSQEPPNVIINIENKSDQPVKQKSGGVQFDGKNFVISTIIENVQQGGVLRGMMAGG